MRVALAQINSLLGDFAGNAQKILRDTQRARESACDLIVFPEAALFGYHPVDLLERPSLVAEQERHLREIHKAIPKGIGVLVGAFVRNKGKGKGFWNAAVFLERGKKPQTFAKQLLPTYDVFDEGRHIEPGDVRKNILRFKGKKILVTICEDIWAWPRKGNPYFSTYGENPLTKVKPRKMDLVVNLSASPFTHTKWKSRQVVTKCTAAHFGAPMVYVNMVGAQDELIFDGGSFAIDKKGRKLAQCVRFDEDFNTFDMKSPESIRIPTDEAIIEDIRQAIVLGIRDFLSKTGFDRVHFGLSGGIDSALVAALAADAIGAKNVLGVMLTGPYTARESVLWSEKLAKNLGIELKEIGINPAYEQLLADFQKTFGEAEFGLMNENLQARIRGINLMAVSNSRKGSLLLGTSNKSEFSVGYSTLYGDMIGGLMPIGDLLKTEVFELARHYNSKKEVIPNEIIERPPSAELRADQKDQDSLPPYDQLDEIIKHLVVEFKAPRTDFERKILGMMMKSEFKRWQAPPILKISDHAFGRGRRFPVAQRSPI